MINVVNRYVIIYDNYYMGHKGFTNKYGDAIKFISRREAWDYIIDYIDIIVNSNKLFDKINSVLFVMLRCKFPRVKVIRYSEI